MTTRRNILRLLTGAPLIAQHAVTALASAATVTSGAAGLNKPTSINPPPEPWGFLENGYDKYCELRDAIDEISDHETGEMPYDIASKRSWSNAMKQTEWAKRRVKKYTMLRLLNNVDSYPSNPAQVLRSINAMKEVAAMLGKDIDL